MWFSKKFHLFYGYLTAIILFTYIYVQYDMQSKRIAVTLETDTVTI